MEYVPKRPRRPGAEAPARRGRLRAFSLVELLVALGVTAVLMTMLSYAFSSISKTWTQSTGRVGAFSAARAGFEAMTRNLSQATLNVNLGYANAEGEPVPLINPSFKVDGVAVDRTQVPTQYLRMSDLHFITSPARQLMAAAGFASLETPGHAVFFQAPTGHVDKPSNRPMETLLNVLGYYVEFSSDDSVRPAGVPPRYRYWLREVIQPAEENGIYASTCETDSSTGLNVYSYDVRWLSRLALDSASSPKSALAENVIFMVLLPKLSPQESSDPGSLVGSQYVYDSRMWEKNRSADRRMRNQLPPIVELIMVAIDEASAERLATQYGGTDGSQPPFAHPQVRAKIDLDAIFRDPGDRDADLPKLEAGLADLGVSYRIFRTDVAIHGAKWSSD